MAQESYDSRNIQVEVEKRNRDLGRQSSSGIQCCLNASLEVLLLCRFHQNFLHIQSVATMLQIALHWDRPAVAYSDGDESFLYHSKGMITSLLYLGSVLVNPLE